MQVETGQVDKRRGQGDTGLEIGWGQKGDAEIGQVLRDGPDVGPICSGGD